MDLIAIFGIISKGLAVVEMAATAGKDIIPALTVIKNLVTGAQAGTVTDAQLADAEAVLDKQIDDFNTDAA